MHKSGFVNIIGNPNVGKSTLMNALVGEKLSIITSKAQTTRHRIMGIVSGEDFQIVYSDTPGILKPSYKLQESMMKFVTGAVTDADVILYVTDTVEQGDRSAEIIGRIRESGIPTVVVINKIDLPSADPDRVAEEIEDVIGLEAHDAPRISAKSGLNVEDVLEAIVEKIPAPEGDPEAPLQALIFDSVYDSYKGVIIFCRVMEGTVKKGTMIRMMATGAKEEVVEVGYFGAGQFIPCDELSAGMVGYITASIKNVKDTAVGDTVTDDNNPCAEPLPGYKKVQSMVYCGLYPADGAKYPDLRDALEKLQLNDASLQFEPETSIALGFGFRCGFLGLLHLEFRSVWRESITLIW